MINNFLKLPINFKNICKIYPPSVNDIYSDENYSLYHNFFTTSQEDIEDLFVENDLMKPNTRIPTPFQFLISQAFNNLDTYEKIKKAFKFFCREEITILFDRAEIMLCNLEEKIDEISSPEELLKIPVIKEENFLDFQNCIRMSLGEEPKEPLPADMHPKKKAMLAKARLRDRIKAKSGKGITLETSIKAICCMGIGLTPLNIGELSVAAITEIMNIYQNKEKYDIDIRSLLAGASSKKIKPKYWISNDD